MALVKLLVMLASGTRHVRGNGNVAARRGLEMLCVKNIEVIIRVGLDY